MIGSVFVTVRGDGYWVRNSALEGATFTFAASGELFVPCASAFHCGWGCSIAFVLTADGAVAIVKSTCAWLEEAEER